jgi:hypothetical protein
LNGGSTFIEDLFKLNLSFLEDAIEESVIPALKKRIDDALAYLVKKLGSPWLAFDECHVPDIHFQGLLFHSDYKKRLTEVTVRLVRVCSVMLRTIQSSLQKDELLSWQQYEQYRTEIRVAPKGYPYKASTSLFSAFRWIAEELLTKQQIMSIFATTHNSCWDTILNDSLYSGDKPKIWPFSALYRLQLKDIRTVLRDFYQVPQNLIDEVPQELLHIWEGRPGFLLDIACSCFTSKTWTASSLKGALTEAKAAALDIIKGKIQDLQSSRSGNSDALLRYFIAMHNGDVRDQQLVDKLVEAGLAIKFNDAAVICENLVFQHLSSMSTTLDQLEEIMVDHCRTDAATLGERAVALQLLQFTGSVAELLKKWCVKLPEFLQQVLERFHLKFTVSCSYKYVC